MNQHEHRLGWAKTFLFAFVQLGLMLMVPAAQAITKANFDKIPTTFQWETANTVIPGLHCDDCAQQINIGFDFPFAGDSFNKVYVSSNGLMSLLAGVSAYGNGDLPTSGAGTTTSALIMPYWDDLNPRVGGSVTYATLGSAPNRRLVVSWNGVPHYPNSGQYNIQAILYETGEIKFQYGAGNNDGQSATIGIEVSNDDYIKHSYNQRVIHANSALLFRPQPYVQSVIQPCGSLNSLMIRYSYPMDAGSAGRKQNYDFVSSPTPGLNVTSASLSPDGYTVKLELNKSLEAGSSYQLRIKDVFSHAGRAINPNPTIRPISGSSGLIGTYYSQYGIQRAYHTGPWIQRNDAQVNFSWNNAVPDILPRGDDFSIHWEGYLIPSRTGSYVFRTYSDDGIRLWVNGTIILDQWNDHSPRYHISSVISLNAGEAVPIVLEHYERGGRAYARLYWDEPDGTSGNFALIPSSALSPCPLTPPGPDHIRIEHDGEGLTCMPESVTVRACANAACTSEFTGNVTTTLNPTGWVGGDTISFTGGHTTAQLSRTSVGAVTLGAGSTTPPPVGAARCYIGPTANCSMNFVDAGFIFSESANGPEASVPHQTAGIPFGPYWLRAVKTNTTTKACEAAIQGRRSVNFNYVCIDPVTCSTGSLMTILSQTVGSAATPLNLDFDADGNASLGSIDYEDVGKIRVNASTTIDNNGTPVVLSGSLKGPGGSPFVVRPDHFDLSLIKCADGTDNPGAIDADGPKFCRAGQDFNVTVTARSHTGQETPNFGQETVPESVKLTSDLVPGLGLSASGTLSGNFGSFSNGEASDNFSWDEVGIITLTPSIEDGDYLGAGDVSGTASGNIGRFYPHHVELTNASLTPACGTFSYMAQPFGLSFKLTAKALGGATTTNYSGDFAKLDPATSIWSSSALPPPPNQAKFALGAKNGTIPLSSRLDLASINPAGSWADGMATITVNNLKFNRAGSPDGPFDPLDLGVALWDEDGVTLESSALDMDTDGDGNNDSKRLGQTTMRFGRMTAERRHQSLETESISLPLTAQYWDGSTFITNDLDNCTTLNTAQLRLDNNEQTNQRDGTILVGGSTVNLTGAGTLNLGVLNLNLSAPGLGHGGFVDITPELDAASYPWLRYDWDSDGDDDDPRGRASWGMYRGNPHVIYMRERWN